MLKAHVYGLLTLSLLISPAWADTPDPDGEARREKIAKLHLVLEKARVDSRASVRLRIADLELEEARARHAALGAAQAKQPIDHSKAVKALKAIIIHHPNYERIDEVYLKMGQALYEMGEEKRGASYALMLSKRHPKSPHTAEALLLIADYYAKEGQRGPAEASYRRVIELAEGGRGKGSLAQRARQALEAMGTSAPPTR